MHATRMHFAHNCFSVGRLYKLWLCGYSKLHGWDMARTLAFKMLYFYGVGQGCICICGATIQGSDVRLCALAAGRPCGSCPLQCRPNTLPHGVCHLAPQAPICFYELLWFLCIARLILAVAWCACTEVMSPVHRLVLAERQLWGCGSADQGPVILKHLQ